MGRKKQLFENIGGNQFKNMKKMLIMLVISMLASYSVMADSKEIYNKSCAKCHGEDGKGDTKMGKKLGTKDYTNAKVQLEMKDGLAFKSVQHGIKDKEGKQVMKPAEELSNVEIKGLVDYMRTFKK